MKIPLLLIGLLYAAVGFASENHYPPDKRAQLPAALNNSYLGFGAGYTSIPYSNSDLVNGYQANHFDNPAVGLNIYIGHYFNPYLGAEIGLMRPIEWAYAYGVQTPADKHSIWISLFDIALRPTLPITKRFSLYALSGLGIISRHGFNIDTSTAIASNTLYTFFTGGGFNYALTDHWFWNVGVEYALAKRNQQQPGITYAYTGFSYLLKKLNLPKAYDTHYLFPVNNIQLGVFSTKIFNPDVNKYFTVGYLPIFWTGDVNTRNGGWLMYTRNFFHTHKMFSLDVGASISSYHSRVNNTPFQAFSIFPEMKLWLIRSLSCDFYFLYAIAGPTYLTRSVIDNIDVGGRFTFQDLLGVGFYLGKAKNFNLGFTLGHYSNGNLLPNNPGIQVPMVISMGYSF